MKIKNKLTIKELKINGSKGFSILAGINRPITPNHVTALATSIERLGILRPCIVANISFLTGAPIDYLIDGQHLYHALMRLGWDIPYTEVEINTEVELAEALAMLNNSSKSWSMKDYITVWSNIRKDYVKLNQYHNTYDIELGQLGEILMENTCTSFSGGNGNLCRIIKRGDFQIGDEQAAVFILNCVTDALKIVPRLDRVSNKLFIASYVSIIVTSKNYDHKRFIVSLDRNKDKFKLATQDAEEFKKLLKSI
jgi:hypothetical protein